MTHCQCQGLETYFNEEQAARGLKRYRTRGPLETTTILIEALIKQGVKDVTILDIGGGVGAIQYALLKAGAKSAVDVDVSAPQIEVARQETTRQGFKDRISHLHGDFVATAADIKPADIVTLDRVICCYHDMESLVTLSSERAQRMYGVVYPRDTWWVKVIMWLGNILPWLQRSDFRIYVHPTAAVETILKQAGFTKQLHHNEGRWQVAVFTRSP